MTLTNQKRAVYREQAMAAKPTKRSKRGGRRPGAGRPSLFRDSADRTIRFERSDLEALDTLAKPRGLTGADLVREAVTLYLAKRRR